MVKLLFIMTAFCYLDEMRRHEQSFYRPSLWFGLLFLVFISGAAAFYYSDAVLWAESEQTRYLAVLYPLFLYLWVKASPGITLVITADDSSGRKSSGIPGLKVFLIGGVFVIVSALLLIMDNVGLKNTGLYALFFDQENYLLAREQTVKLLDSSLVKGVYSISTTVVIPLLIALIYKLAGLKLSWRFVLIGIFVLAATVVSINGAKFPLGMLVSFFAILYYMDVGLKKAFLVFCAVFLLVFSISITLLWLGSRNEWNGIASFSFYYIVPMLKRIFVTPFETGMWHQNYVQLNGVWGWQAIGFPFKVRFGFDHVAFYGIVGRWYAETIGSGMQSTWMNSSVLFSQHAIFGVWFGTISAVLLVIVLDAFLYISRVLNWTYFRAFHALLLFYCVDLISTDAIGVLWRGLFALMLLYLYGYGVNRITTGLNKDKIR